MALLAGVKAHKEATGCDTNIVWPKMRKACDLTLRTDKACKGRYFKAKDAHSAIAKLNKRTGGALLLGAALLAVAGLMHLVLRQLP